MARVKLLASACVALFAGIAASAGEPLTGMVLVTQNGPPNLGTLAIYYGSTGQTQTIIDEPVFGPSFSPDGTQVSFMRNGKICAAGIDGANIVELADCANPPGNEAQVVTNWCENGYIYWAHRDTNIYRVPSGGGSPEIVISHNNQIILLGVNRQGTRAAWMAPMALGSGINVNVWGYSSSADLAAGTINFVDADNNYVMPGCHADVSGDGKVSNLQAGHGSSKIWDYPGGEPNAFTTITTPLGSFSNHRFPHYVDGYIMYTRDGGDLMGAVHRLSDNYVWQIGAATYPWDMYSNESPGDPDAVRVTSFAATPASISEGVTSTLTWSTVNATSISIAPDVGAVAATGSVDVTPMANTTYTLTATGAADTVTRTASVTVLPPQGGGSGILKEIWTGIAGATVADLLASPDYPDNPTTSEIVSSFAGEIDYAEDFGTRMRGFVIPPATGDYVFMLSSDDYSILYLSTDEDPANAVEIARLDGWALPDDYPSLSAAITLTQGERYYVEALHKEGAVGDHIQVGWQLPGGAIEAPIPGHRLDPWGGGEAPSDTEAPTVEITAPTDGADVYDSVTVSGSAADDVGVVSVEVSVAGGAYATAIGNASWSVWSYVFDATLLAEDTHTIDVRARDAAGNEVIDSITISVNPSATLLKSITILEPEAGDVWYVGTTRLIRWTAANLDAVTIYYTTDGGANWDQISASEPDTSPAWGAYPWTVVDEASTACQISLTGYLGEAPTHSGVFMISAITDADGDGMDDGWETALFGDMTHDATTDADEDGDSDYDEFMAGTDPLLEPNTSEMPSASSSGPPGFCAVGKSAPSGGAVCALAFVVAAACALKRRHSNDASTSAARSPAPARCSRARSSSPDAFRKNAATAWSTSLPARSDETASEARSLNASLLQPIVN